MKYFSKRMQHTRYAQIGHSAICIGVFRVALNRGLLKITFLQHTLGSILGPLFAGVVYGVSLTYCMIAPYGVILK